MALAERPGFSEGLLRALEDLQGAFSEGEFQAEDEAGRAPGMLVLARGLEVALTALAASVGECQMDVPYAPIQMVRHPDGTKEWCCSHSPSHCDTA